jgi:hypothetical protein
VRRLGGGAVATTAVPAITQRRRGVGAAVCSAVAVARSIAASSAATSGQRRAGSGSRPRDRMPRSAGGMLDASACAGPRSIASRSTVSLAPANGRLPASASHSDTQNANWSVAGDTSPPAHCSGAM